VSEVVEDSPCARLGIVPRTVITHVNGIPLAGQVDKKTERRVWKPDNGTVLTIKNDSVVKTVTYEE
jgi:C-terminal processing protease CtpA/Prc